VHERFDSYDCLALLAGVVWCVGSACYQTLPFLPGFTSWSCKACYPAPSRRDRVRLLQGLLPSCKACYPSPSRLDRIRLMLLCMCKSLSSLSYHAPIISLSSHAPLHVQNFAEKTSKWVLSKQMQLDSKSALMPKLNLCMHAGLRGISCSSSSSSSHSSRSSLRSSRPSSSLCPAPVPRLQYLQKSHKEPLPVLSGKDSWSVLSLARGRANGNHRYVVLLPGVLWSTRLTHMHTHTHTCTRAHTHTHTHTHHSVVNL